MHVRHCANIVRQLLSLGAWNEPKGIDVTFFKTNYISFPSWLHLPSIENQVLSTMEWLCMNNIYENHTHFFASSPSGICSS
jgi:hypothetical protein